MDNIEGILGYNFTKRELLELALTHSSVGGDDYERLEFLGDAVLDLAVAEILITQKKEASEGELTKLRAAIVNSDNLAELSKECGLVDAIRLGPGGAGSRNSIKVMSDVLEAVIGAVFLDGGYDEARNVVAKLIKVDGKIASDPKTELQELVQKIYNSTPEYELKAMSGPEHEPTFESMVKIGGIVRGQGAGRSKKDSQKEAAREALRWLESRRQSGN